MSEPPAGQLSGEEILALKFAAHRQLARLAQHADHQLDSQRLFLAALQEAVEAGDAPARHAACLVDRVAMNEGRPQTYGTQIAGVEDGEGIPWPIADPEQLDERRARAGLEPFEEYVAQWRAMR